MRKFSWVNRVCAVVGLATLSAGADAAILVLTEQGAVLSVNTTTAVATPFANYGDVPPATGPAPMTTIRLTRSVTTAACSTPRTVQVP